MMARLKEEKQETSSIEVLSNEELLKKIEGDSHGSKYSDEQLIAIIENEKMQLKFRHAAYLSLIIRGELSDLQRLASIMDFSYKDSNDCDVFRTAVIFDRIDVMYWLYESIPVFKNIPLEDRTNIVLHAVTCDREEVLEELAKPVDKGGFGWDLNVRHKNGFTPVKMAVKDGNKMLALRLVAPVDEGGFGLQLEKRELRKLHMNLDFALFSGMTPRYRRSKPEKRTSSLMLAEGPAMSPHAETYEPESILGTGGYGTVRMFAAKSDPSKKVAVKQAGINKKNEALSGFHVYVSGENAVHELTFLRRAYPHEGPYKLQHYVINEGKGYDYRMVMPVVPGKEFQAVVLDTRNADEMALLLLAICEELHRIHQLGIVHGDVRPRNILIDIQRDAHGTPVFKVHFIDFYYAAKIGKPVTVFEDARLDIPPELRSKKDEHKRVSAHPAQDIFTLGFFVNLAVEPFLTLIQNDYPGIIKFCEASKNVNPDERPKLSDFISEMRRDLDARHCEPRAVCGARQPSL